tara:strand:+ start:332 stop:523 length:192 start_codon:yes stop_codon:yes gene_type:complete
VSKKNESKKEGFAYDDNESVQVFTIVDVVEYDCCGYGMGRTYVQQSRAIQRYLLQLLRKELYG